MKDNSEEKKRKEGVKKDDMIGNKIGEIKEREEVKK